MRNCDRNLKKLKNGTENSEEKGYQCLHGFYSKWVLTLITVSTM